MTHPGRRNQFVGGAATTAVRLVRTGYGWSMLKKVEIEVDDDLVQEAIRRYKLADAREAVHLALRTLLGENAGDEHDDEYDELSDPSAWEPRRNSGSG